MKTPGQVLYESFPITSAFRAAWVELQIKDVYEDAAVAFMRAWYLDRLKLLRAQDQGAGGNLRPEEIVRAMQRYTDELIYEIVVP